MNPPMDMAQINFLLPGTNHLVEIDVGYSAAA